MRAGSAGRRSPTRLRVSRLNEHPHVAPDGSVDVLRDEGRFGEQR